MEYQRRPRIAYAVQFHNNRDEIKDFIRKYGDLDTPIFTDHTEYIDVKYAYDYYGNIVIFDGYWVVYENGDFEICTGMDFHALYEGI